jgi:hypothetical protein
MMIGDVMALEMLEAIGGEQTKERIVAFQKMCRVIVDHIHKYGEVQATVNVVTAGAMPGTVALPGIGTATGKIV